MRSIDLNADLGEGAPFDYELLQIISSASVACGGHAGDIDTMGCTLLQAKQAGVVTGAHPGYLDKENFGRVQLDISAGEAAKQVVAQLQALEQVSERVGQPISYVKLHGALYNRAAQDFAFSFEIFEALQNYRSSIIVLALDRSAQMKAAQRLGLRSVAEAFVDRAYTDFGLLVERGQPGAVYDDVTTAVDQAVTIARDREVVSQTGKHIKSQAKSLCLHGDNRAALEMADAVRNGLQLAGFSIRAAV